MHVCDQCQAYADSLGLAPCADEVSFCRARCSWLHARLHVAALECPPEIPVCAAPIRVFLHACKPRRSTMLSIFICLYTAVETLGDFSSMVYRSISYTVKFPMSVSAAQL